MSAELLINVTPSESRVALIENGILQEIHVERHTKRGIVGNIYRGKVSRVLPGMQAAFVDIGFDKAAFLHASDIVIHDEVADELTSSDITKQDIRELVRDGQDIVVQVVKDFTHVIIKFFNHSTIEWIVLSFLCPALVVRWPFYAKFLTVFFKELFRASVNGCVYEPSGVVQEERFVVVLPQEG